MSLVTAMEELTSLPASRNVQTMCALCNKRGRQAGLKCRKKERSLVLEGVEGNAEVWFCVVVL